MIRILAAALAVTLIALHGGTAHASIKPLRQVTSADAVPAADVPVPARSGADLAVILGLAVSASAAGAVLRGQARLRILLAGAEFTPGTGR